MLGYGEYTIICFEEKILQIKEILEISLNTIFFHRYLGSEKFDDMKTNLNNINYVKLKNEKLSNNINNILNEIESNFKDKNNYGQRLSLSFYEKGKNPWEKWNFILILSKKEDSKQKEELNSKSEELEDDKGNKIREYIFKLIEKLTDKENFMPNINLDDNSIKDETFLYNISIEKIATKEDYRSLYFNLVENNQENTIKIDLLP